MTKANDLASLLDANGDVVSSALDNVPSADLVNDTTPQLGGTLDTNTNDINFGTNVKSNYGTSAQLMMYHDGSNGWIKGNNTGNNSIAIQSGGTGSVMISGSSGQNIISQQGDAAYLHHAGFAKLITTATGVDVTGGLNTTGNVGIGGSETTVFNGVGGDMKFVVIGDDSTTTVGNNSDAGIAIVNTNQTAGNLAGLHFARADTDDTPNYAGASIVAQFPEAQVTGQYPKGDLAFLTSTAANSAPSEKMRLTAAGNLLAGTTGALITGTAKLSVNGQIEAVTSNTPVIDIARSDGSGSIINLRKGGGAVVGSIGSYAGLYTNIGTSDVGLMFNTGAQAIIPHNMSTNATRDNAIDLGQAGIRWKDLYISNRLTNAGTGGVRIDGYDHAYIRKKGTHQYEFACGAFTAGQGKKIFTTNAWTAGGGSITVFQNAGFFGVGQFSFILHYGGCAFTLQHGTSNYATFSVNLNTPTGGQTEVYLTIGYAMSDVRVFLNFDGYPYYGAGALINSVGSGITMTEVAHHSLA